MAIALVASMNTGGSSSTVTTGAITSTGANLIVVSLNFYGSTGPLNLSDSKGNTWTSLTPLENANGQALVMHYCSNPIVGTGHTFTSVTDYPCLAVAAFSGVKATSPFDVQNGSVAGGSPTQPGSVTPSENNELVVTGAAIGTTSGAVSINSGFTIPNATNYGAAFGASIAYLIQTTAGAVNPTWTLPASGYGTALQIATFKAEPGGGGANPKGPLGNPFFGPFGGPI